MSIIKDVLDTLGELKTSVAGVAGLKKQANQTGDSREARFFSRPMDSVARQAKKSVLYFPVVASESLSAETVQIIAKAVQVRAAEYVRLWVTNMDPVSLSSHGKAAVISSLRGASLKDALVDPNVVAETAAVDKLVRTKLSQLVEHVFFEEGLNRPLTDASALLTEAIGRKPGTSLKFEPAAAAAAQKRVVNTGELRALIEPLENLLKNGSAGRAEAMRRLATLMRDDRFTRDQILEINRDLAPLLDEVDRDADAAERRRQERNAPAPERLSPEQMEIERRRRLVADTIELANRRDEKNQLSRVGRVAAMRNIQELLSTNDGDGLAKLRANPETAKIVAMMEKIPGRILDDGSYEITGNGARVSDGISFDKLNAFQPVLLDLQIRFQLADGSLDQGQTSVMLGVKGVAHQVPGLDLVTGLGTALQRDSLLLQFFRMTSGETSFVKDFLLNLDTAKVRASGRTTAGAKVLETLRRQAEWNTRRANVVVKSMTDRGFVPPTTTMVVSADEVEQIKSMYGVDFSKPGAVRELLKSHNLMGFIIVDEAIGLVRVFEDGDDDFDRLPITTLKSQGKETSVKDIMTILARS